MRRNRGFTLIELLVVIGVIAVLIGILVPVVTSARNSAKKTQCAANLRTIFQSMSSYAADNDRKLPVFGNDSPWLWNIPLKTRDALLKSGADRKSLYCPLVDTEDDDTFWYSPNGTAPKDPDQNTENVSTNVGYFVLQRRVPKAKPSSTATDPAGGSKLQDSGFKFKDRDTKKTYKGDPRQSIDQARPAELELASDITISTGTGTARKFSSIVGADYHHASHLTSDKIKAEGGNVVFLDGHVAWRQWKEPPAAPTTPVGDDQMQIRYTSPTANIDHWF
jgi:prepilin-type N-terminal cleavage/methylation domain-containing protein/prepilin-type processing-associated H-X9-DG protein